MPENLTEAQARLRRVVKAPWLVRELEEAEREFARWPEIKRNGIVQRAAEEE